MNHGLHLPFCRCRAGRNSSWVRQQHRPVFSQHGPLGLTSKSCHSTRRHRRSCPQSTDVGSILQMHRDGRSTRCCTCCRRLKYPRAWATINGWCAMAATMWAHTSGATATITTGDTTKRRGLSVASFERQAITAELHCFAKLSHFRWRKGAQL